MIKEIAMFVSNSLRLKSDRFSHFFEINVDCPLFSEKQIEEEENKNQKWRAHSDTPAKFFPSRLGTLLYCITL